MAEYIERSDAAFFFENSKQTMWHKDDIAATISSKKNIPSADVVEVVRCKDCKFAFPHNDYYYCENEDSPFTNSDWAVCPNGDDFCSWGERRSDNEPT